MFMLLSITTSVRVHPSTILAIATHRDELFENGQIVSTAPRFVSALYACDENKQPTTLIAEIGTVIEPIIAGVSLPDMRFYPIDITESLEPGRYRVNFLGSQIVGFYPA